MLSQSFAAIMIMTMHQITKISSAVSRSSTPPQQTQQLPITQTTPERSNEPKSAGITIEEIIPFVNTRDGNEKHVLIYGGAFCPPHRQHFENILPLYQYYDHIVIMLDPQGRHYFSAEQSEEIWNIYKQYLPDRGDKIKIAMGYSGRNPNIAGVIRMYKEHNFPGNDIITQKIEGSRIDILIGTDHVKEAGDLQANVEGVLNEGGSTRRLTRVHGGYDAERLTDIIHSSVIIGHERVISATAFREAIKNNDRDMIKEFLPRGMSSEDIELVLMQLRG